MGSSVSAPGAKEAEEKEEEKVVGEAIFLGPLHTVPAGQVHDDLSRDPAHGESCLLWLRTLESKLKKSWPVSEEEEL
jgi:hypothetical protein